MQLSGAIFYVTASGYNVKLLIVVERTICDLLSLLSNHKKIVRFSPFTYHDIYKSGDYGNRDILNFEITRKPETKHLGKLLQLVQFSLAQMKFPLFVGLCSGEESPNDLNARNMKKLSNKFP